MGSFKLDSIKVFCLVIIYIFFQPGKVLSETAQFRLLPLAKLQLSGEKFWYIFQTRFMGEGVCNKVYRGVQYSGVEVTWWRVEEVVVTGVGGLESGDWWLLLH